MQVVYPTFAWRYEVKPQNLRITGNPPRYSKRVLPKRKSRTLILHQLALRMRGLNPDDAMES
jgi:hypothetical protein